MQTAVQGSRLEGRDEADRDRPGLEPAIKGVLLAGRQPNSRHAGWRVGGQRRQCRPATGVSSNSGSVVPKSGQVELKYGKSTTNYLWPARRARAWAQLRFGTGGICQSEWVCNGAQAVADADKGISRRVDEAHQQIGVGRIWRRRSIITCVSRRCWAKHLALLDPEFGRNLARGSRGIRCCRVSAPHQWATSSTEPESFVRDIRRSTWSILTSKSLHCNSMTNCWILSAARNLARAASAFAVVPASAAARLALAEPANADASVVVGRGTEAVQWRWLFTPGFGGAVLSSVTRLPSSMSTRSSRSASSAIRECC